MCGRFSQQRPASELAEIFAAEPLADELGPRWNVAPTDEAYIVVQREDRRAVVAYRWGLIPHWSDSAKVASRMFNARSESLGLSPAFADALRRKRCLVPVVLPESAWDLWLDPGLGDPGELQGLFEPTDEVPLRIEPVADLVNNVRNDGPDLIRPIDLAELERATAGPPGLF